MRTQSEQMRLKKVSKVSCETFCRGAVLGLSILLLANTPAKAMSGHQAAQIYQQCLVLAEAKSPSAAWTVRGKAYIRAYVKTCMVSNDVPADLVMALMMQ